MPFSIEYTPEQSSRYPMPKAKKGKKGIYMVVLAILVGVILLGKNDIQKQDKEGLQVANRGRFEQMVQDVREGTPVSDAFTMFCLDILKDAEIY